MTEKIARRGIRTPDSYQQDILEKTTVGEVMDQGGLVLDENNSIKEVREWLGREEVQPYGHFIIVSSEGRYRGIINASALLSDDFNETRPVGSFIKYQAPSVSVSNDLRTAVEIMAKEKIDVLPVVSKENRKALVGILSYKDVINAYRQDMDHREQKKASISFRIQGLKILIKGQKLFLFARNSKK